MRLVLLTAHNSGAVRLKIKHRLSCLPSDGNDDYARDATPPAMQQYYYDDYYYYYDDYYYELQQPPRM